MGVLICMSKIGFHYSHQSRIEADACNNHKIECEVKISMARPSIILHEVARRLLIESAYHVLIQQLHDNHLISGCHTSWVLVERIP